MRKQQMIKELRDVLCGNSNRTFIKIEKIKRSWCIQTGLSSFENTEDSVCFRHCVNSMTLKEATEIFDAAYYAL